VPFLKTGVRRGAREKATWAALRQHQEIAEENKQLTFLRRTKKWVRKYLSCQ
jgi:hypothetical protein